MTVDANPLVRGMASNLAWAAIVFLPVFLLMNVVELKVRGVTLAEPISYFLSGAAVIYLSMSLPVFLGSIVHSTALSLVSSGVARSRRRMAAVAFASLVPVTVILLGVPLFSDFPGSAAIATLVYGLCCAHGMGRGPTAGEAASHSEKA